MDGWIHPTKSQSPVGWIFAVVILAWCLPVNLPNESIVEIHFWGQFASQGCGWNHLHSHNSTAKCQVLFFTQQLKTIHLKAATWKIRIKKKTVPFKNTQNPIATTINNDCFEKKCYTQFLNPRTKWNTVEAMELHHQVSGGRHQPTFVTSLHCQVSALTIRGKVQTTHRVGKATQPSSWSI